MQYRNYEFENQTDEEPWHDDSPPSLILTDPPDSKLMPLTPNPLAPNPNSPLTNPAPDTIVVNTLLQSVQQTQAQQMYLLRNLDARLARLEELPRAATVQNINAPSFERATWWILWGLLMLVMGGALAAVTFLILLNQFG